MKKINKISVLLLVFVILIGILPVRAEAAKVKLNKTKATIYAGGSVKLKVSGKISKAKWTTSNKKVATVNSKGKVTGKKAGKATITVKVGKKSYQCKVTVKAPYLNSTKKTLKEGKTFTLKITGTTAQSWSSSNKSVAVVSSKGKVTAKKAGTATITCKGKNGKKYKCKITVTAKAIQPHTHDYGSGTITIKATDNSVGYMKYSCKICGETITKKYGKAQTFSHRLASKNATLYGYWDLSEANKILESINQYRKSKGFSELTLKDEYQECAMNLIQAGYFGIDDFNAESASGRYPTFISYTPQAACDASGYFERYLADNANLFEKEGIEVGIAYFVDIKYYNSKTNTVRSTYANDYNDQLINYYVEVCIYE